MRRATASLVILTMAAVLVAPAAAQMTVRHREQDDKTLDTQVETAIRQAMKYLWKTQQGDGRWGAQGQCGVGKTALLTADETKKTYSLGLRCYVWHLANRNTLGKYRDNLKKDAEVLIKWGMVNGRYAYSGSGGDNSNSQHGLLGVWAAAADGLEIPSEYWAKVLGYWQGTQGGSGRWDYRGPGNTPTMTAAGVATLYVCYDYSGLADANPGKEFAPIAKGVKWFDTNFKPAGSEYYFYGLERVGLACGYKFFGKHDWYDPPSAFDVMRNVVLYAASINAAPDERLLKGPAAKPQDATTTVGTDEF